MRNILVTIMVISILFLLVEAVIVFNHLKNKLHTYLFLNCIVMIINNTGYLLELLSGSQDTYIASLQFSYLGRVWITFSLLMFTAELCHVQVPKWVTVSLVAFHSFVYACVFTQKYNDLYYPFLSYQKRDLFPYVVHSNGIVYNLFMQVQVIYIMVAIIWFTNALYQLDNPKARKRIWILVGGYLIESAFFIVQIKHVFEFTYFFDICQLGNLAVTLSMFIAIFRYNLLGIIDVARDYIIDKLSEGVIAVDPSGQVQYYNEHAKTLYPDLKVKPSHVVEDVKWAIKAGETIARNDRFYTPEANDLNGDDEKIGTLYALVDTTVMKQREQKLKSDAAFMELAAQGMRERLLTTEELVQQDRKMRHDRRHFEALLLSLLQDGKVDEARRCLEERLSMEPHAICRYCENTTINAALTHYVGIAERKNIQVDVKTNIPKELDVDEMQLAIAISNLLENAIIACEKLPETERFIEIRAKFKNQLLLEICNSSGAEVKLDEEGHPSTNAAGHGIGTRSVLAFIEETNSDIQYQVEEGRFKVRAIIA